MEPLDDLERAVLDMMAAGEAPQMRRLQEQLATCVVRNRELTGVGFFTSLDVDRVSVAPVEGLTTPFGDVYAEIDGLAHGAGFLLWIEDGYADTLEGYSFGDEPWPEVIGVFTLLPWSLVNKLGSREAVLQRITSQLAGLNEGRIAVTIEIENTLVHVNGFVQDGIFKLGDAWRI